MDIILLPEIKIVYDSGSREMKELVAARDEVGRPSGTDLAKLVDA